MVVDLGVLSHLAAGLAFASVSLAILMRRDLSGADFWLALSCIVTAMWGGAIALWMRFGGAYLGYASVLETLKAAGLTGLLIVLLYPTWNLRERAHYTFVLAIGLGFVFALQLSADVARLAGHAVDLRNGEGAAILTWMPRLASSVGGLLLVENIYRNATAAYRWRLRMLLVGIAVLFAYEVFVYSGPAISGRIAGDAVAARGLVHLAVVPLIFIALRRNNHWTSDFQISRKVAFHSVSLVAVGLYLMATSAVAYAVRVFGGSWGNALQIAAVVCLLMALALVAMSDQARSWIKVKVLKHFFAYRYDYREEWLRLIATVAQGDSKSDPLEQRVARGICDILESKAGSLWLVDDIGDYALAGAHGPMRTEGIHIEASAPMVSYMRKRQRIINLDDLREGDVEYERTTLPPWLQASEQAWAVVPLIHLDRLIAFVIVARPNVARSLDWEDFDLLKTVGRQAASYLAEQISQKTLIESARFDDFNRRFAFIIHDIKNLVSQLSLLSRNAERHADNPEFRADMVATLKGSVGKMNDLLARMREHHGQVEALVTLDIQDVVAQVVSEKQRSHGLLSLRCEGDPPVMTAPRERLAQVFSHLIQNAIDASGPQSPVAVAIVSRAGYCDVEIRDQGSGMTEAFVRNELFKPFRSTKAGGYGIGAYEAREIVRSLQGSLHVRSVPGEGSIFVVRLPLNQSTDAPPALEAVQ